MSTSKAQLDSLITALTTASTAIAAAVNQLDSDWGVLQAKLAANPTDVDYTDEANAITASIAQLTAETQTTGDADAQIKTD